jgi:hypothetical protein
MFILFVLGKNVANSSNCNSKLRDPKTGDLIGECSKEWSYLEIEQKTGVNQTQKAKQWDKIINSIALSAQGHKPCPNVSNNSLQLTNTSASVLFTENQVMIYRNRFAKLVSAIMLALLSVGIVTEAGLAIIPPFVVTRTARTGRPC